MAVRQRHERGSAWMVDFWYIDRGGARRRHRQLLADDITTKRQALAEERRIVEEVNRAQAAPERVAAIFSGWAATWWDEWVKPDTKPTTARAYERVLRLQLVPAFGDLDLRAVTTEKVQRAKAAWLKTLSAKSVRNVLGVLSSMFEQAIKLVE